MIDTRVGYDVPSGHTDTWATHTWAFTVWVLGPRVRYVVCEVRAKIRGKVRVSKYDFNWLISILKLIKADGCVTRCLLKLCPDIRVA